MIFVATAKPKVCILNNKHVTFLTNNNGVN